MTTAEQRPRVGVASEWTLPPGWEALRSEKDNKIYYWNKKTGDTTWKFPEKEGEWGPAKLSFLAVSSGN